MKKKLILLFLAIVLLFVGCSEESTGGTDKDSGGGKSKSSTIEFQLNGQKSWIKPAKNGTGYIYTTVQERTLSNSDLAHTGITSVDSATMRIVARYVGKCVLSDGVYTLTVEKIEIHGEFECSNPDAATAEFLNYMNEQNSEMGEMYATLFGKDYVDASSVGMGNEEYIGAKFEFAAKNQKLTYLNTYLPDGGLDTELTFHPNGASHISRYYGEYGMIRQEDEYSEDGIQIRSKTYDSNGNISNVCEYHENGNVKKDTTYRTNGNLSCVYEYDEEQRLIRESSYYENGNRNYYTEYTNNITTLTISYYENGTEEYRYEYDEYGQLLKETRFHEDGSLSSFAEYTNNIKVLEYYVENGIEIYLFENGVIKKDYWHYSDDSIKVFEYDENNNVTVAIRYYPYSDKIYCYEEYEDGNIVLEVYYDENGTETGRYKY